MVASLIRCGIPQQIEKRDADRSANGLIISEFPELTNTMKIPIDYSDDKARRDEESSPNEHVMML